MRAICAAFPLGQVRDCVTACVPVCVPACACLCLGICICEGLFVCAWWQGVGKECLAGQGRGLGACVCVWGGGGLARMSTTRPTPAFTVTPPHVAAGALRVQPGLGQRGRVQAGRRWLHGLHERVGGGGGRGGGRRHAGSSCSSSSRCSRSCRRHMSSSRRCSRSDRLPSAKCRFASQAACPPALPPSRLLVRSRDASLVGKTKCINTFSGYECECKNGMFQVGGCVCVCGGGGG